MARPKLQINEEQVKQLAAINCSLAEMGAVLDCSEDTLGRRFADVIKKGRDTGRMSLKRKMWETAMGGNITMMIWLSKQLLGYTDKVEQKQWQTHSADPKLAELLNQKFDSLKKHLEE